MRSISSSSTATGRRNEGMLVRISPPPLGSFSNSTQVIAERQQVARHGQRGRAGADQRDALAVLLRRDLRHEGVDLALVVGGDALQAADGDRLLLDAAAPAGGLARAIADAAEDAGEDVALPVQHVGRRIAPLGDQPDVLGNGRMASDMPTGSRRPCGSIADWRCRSGPCGPCFVPRCRSPASLRPCASASQPVILLDRDALSQLLH